MDQIRPDHIVAAFGAHGPATKEEVFAVLPGSTRSMLIPFREAIRAGLIEKVTTDIVAGAVTWQLAAAGERRLASLD